MELILSFLWSRIVFVPLAGMQFEPANMPEIGWFSSTWHPAGNMERFSNRRSKAFTCGFSFSTPTLLLGVRPRMHSFDENRPISGRTPSFFARKESQALGMGASNGMRFGEQGDERSESAADAHVKDAK